MEENRAPHVRTELKRLNVKTLCENGVCRNPADYEVAREDTPLSMRLHLCQHCLRALVMAAKKQRKKERKER